MLSSRVCSMVYDVIKWLRDVIPVLTMAVRNCLECRYETGTLAPVRHQLSARNGGDRSGDPIKSLVEGAKYNLQVSALLCVRHSTGHSIHSLLAKIRNTMYSLLCITHCIGVA